MAKGGSAPPAPDPAATAAAQQKLNTQAAQDNAKYSAVDMYGPYGNVIYQRDANGVPLSQTTTLDPTNQQTLNIQNQIGLQLAGKAQDTLAGLPTGQYSMRDAPYDPRAVNTGQMSIWGKGANDFAYDPNSYGDLQAFDQKAADSVWNAGAARLDPIFAQQRDRQAQTMQDRGLPIDGEASRQMGQNLDANQNDAYLQLQNQAYQTGHQVGQDRINMEQQLRGNAINEALTFNNQSNSDWLQRLQTEQQLRGQIQNEDVQDRQRAFNEASIYLQGAPVYGTPNQVAAPQYQVNPADYASAAYATHNGNLLAAQLADKRQAAMWDGIGQGVGAATSIWKLSSSKLKIELGDADSFLTRARQLRIRHYVYRDPQHGEGDQLGPWAEDYAALFGGPNDRIDIGNALFVLWRAFQELVAKIDAQQPAAA